MMINFSQSAQAVTSVALALSLTSCGWWEDPDASAPAPSTAQSTTAPESPATVTAPAEEFFSVTVSAIKTFSFSWSAIEGATSYRLLEDPDGTSGYTQVGQDLAASAVSHDLVVPLYKRVNARYVLQSCNSAGCSDSAPVMIGASLNSGIGMLKSSKPESRDFYGFALSLSGDGNTLAVGARSEDNGNAGINSTDDNSNASGSGAVYVYSRGLDNQWIQQAYLKSAIVQADDSFGTSVSLSNDGNTVAIGASGESNANSGFNPPDNDQSESYSGAVYVFTRSANTWSQQAYLKSSNPTAYDIFGISVTLSGDGNNLAVGARGESNENTGVDPIDNNTNAVSSGAVYVFTRSANVWAQQAYLKSSNPQSSDYFGNAISLSEDGSTLAVGTLNEDNPNSGINPADTSDAGSDSGSTYVFARDGGVWTQQAYLKASDNEAGAQFGASVSLSSDGNTLAVGAPGNDNGPNGSTPSSGGAYLFSRSNQAWVQQSYLTSHPLAANSSFGISLNLSADGNALAVGAFSDSSADPGIAPQVSGFTEGASGAAYFFARSAGVWSTSTKIKSTKPDDADFFGGALSLSNDGNSLAVGARGEASATAGINPADDNANASRSGAVYLY